MIKHVAVAFFALLACACSAIPSVSEGSGRGGVGAIQIPLAGLPENDLSMEQSLSITSAFYETSHAAIERAYGDRDRWTKITIGIFDMVTATLPLGDVWLHEEFHRAVLDNRGIDSYNDVYKFDFGAETIAVSRVRDEDLVRLKRDHPADQVRLGAAGMEGELLLVQRLEKNHFFRETSAWHLPLYWMTKVSTVAYVLSGGTREADERTDRSNAGDGADIRRRDFTGHDFNGWVYDLFRPDEPYETRGVHPSGVGIDRYRKSTHLTAEERAYLRKQGRLALLNFLDPHLVGVDGWKVRNAGVNVSATHYLTSFGYTVDVNVFLRDGDRKLFLILRRYANADRAFPGIDAEWLDQRITLGNRTYTASPRVALWLQPERQRFRDTDAAFGGLAAVRLATHLRGRYGAFVELEAKTGGWVPGNVHLDPNTALRLGLTVR